MEVVSSTQKKEIMLFESERFRETCVKDSLLIFLFELSQWNICLHLTLTPCVSSFTASMNVLCDFSLSSFLSASNYDLVFVEPNVQTDARNSKVKINNFKSIKEGKQKTDVAAKLTYTEGTWRHGGNRTWTP